MKIELLKDVPAYRNKKGSVINVPEKRGQMLILQGFARPLGGSPVENTIEHMRPPRHICPCGYVGNNELKLLEHRKNCDNQPIKLNLGCGTVLEEGFINIDIRELEGVLVHDVADLSDLKLSGVSYILADDVLEHFPQKEAETILAHWVSLLSLGGTIEIRCPDITHAAKISKSDDWLIQLIYGGQDYPENFHRSGYTLATMKRRLEKLNLKVISEELTREGNMVVKAKK